MDFFDKLGKKFSQTYNAASEKTSKIAKETKLRISISECEGNLKDIYKKIGKIIYEKYQTRREEDLAMEFIKEFKEVDTIKQKIQDMEREILDLKDKVKCSKCGNLYEATFEFCPKCGQRQKEEDRVE
jgi:rubrerythrin